MLEAQTWQLSADDNPPYKEWMERCRMQMVLREPSLDPQSAVEHAGQYYFLGRGKYTPEEMADIMTGFYEPLLKYAHLLSSSGRMTYSAIHPLLAHHMPEWARPEANTSIWATASE